MLLTWVHKDVDTKEDAVEIPDLKLGSDSRGDTFLLKTPLSSLETIQVLHRFHYHWLHLVFKSGLIICWLQQLKA